MELQRLKVFPQLTTTIYHNDAGGRNYYHPPNIWIEVQSYHSDSVGITW